MTSETSRPQPDSRPTPGRLTDVWDADRWRSPIAGVVVGAVTTPAVGLLLAGLLVLAVQGQVTWLYVVVAALVLSGLGALGTTVALRGGHRGVVHRLAVLTWVWSVLVVVAGIVVALRLDVPERIGVAVLLVLGGAYGVVLGLALWGASRVMPAPAAAAAQETPARAAPTTTTRLSDLVDEAQAEEAPTASPGAGPDERAGASAGTTEGAPVEAVHAEAPGEDGDEPPTSWPAWGATDPATGETEGPDEATGTPVDGAGPGSADDDVVVTEVVLVEELVEDEPLVTEVLVVEEATDVERAPAEAHEASSDDVPAVDAPPAAAQEGAAPPQEEAAPARKPRRTPPRGARGAPPEDEHPTTRHPAVGADEPAAEGPRAGAAAAGGPRPRSASSGSAATGARSTAGEGRRPVRRSARPAPRRDGEEGPPTERLPPVRR